VGRVAITGVAGFLGSHLADKFLAEGWEVVGIDSFIGGYPENVPDGVIFYEHDLSEALDATLTAFQGVGIVIHTACTAYEGLSVFSPSLITRHTVQATANVMSAAVSAGVGKVVYLSSMARYGDHGGKLFTEDEQPKPQDPYGIAKVSSELLVQNIADTHGLDWTVLVPHNIIGARQKYDDPYRNVASIMTNRMLQGLQPIIYGDGTQQRCFSFVKDVVDPLYAACFTPEANRRVINIGPDEQPITINQLAELLAGIIGFELDPIYTPGRPQEVPIALCSSDLARELLGYQTSTTLEDGLAELVAWIKSKGTKPFSYHLPVEIINDKTPATWAKKLF
jgi:UDP-glucose 4-epimerase